jgi:hypothetical protein
LWRCLLTLSIDGCALAPCALFHSYRYKSAKKPADGQKVPDDQWLITNEKDRFLQVSGKWQVVDYQVSERVRALGSSI